MLRRPEILICRSKSCVVGRKDRDFLVNGHSYGVAYTYSCVVNLNFVVDSSLCQYQICAMNFFFFGLSMTCVKLWRFFLLQISFLMIFLAQLSINVSYDWSSNLFVQYSITVWMTLRAISLLTAIFIPESYQMFWFCHSINRENIAILSIIFFSVYMLQWIKS